MAEKQVEADPSLDPVRRLALLRTMWTSRLGDLREQSLIRQGRGWFHIAGMGHEAMAALALELRDDDYLFPYYRDRALVLQRGVPNSELAASFYAKRDSSSGGRQLPGHFSYRERNVWSHPSPVGAHVLPACGAAWGMQLDGKDSLVYVSLGDAGARQGDFFEAICFARERKLPMLFVVQDNRIAISTDTTRTNPLALGILEKSDWIEVDGSDVNDVAKRGREAVQRIRAGEGPVFLWCNVERFSNHSSADDQRMYREAAVLDGIQRRDPIPIFAQALIDAGEITAGEAAAIEEETKERVRADYKAAEAGEDPRADELARALTGELPPAESPPVELGERCRMLDAVNKTFHTMLERNGDIVFFGEDIADPKGGVFNLTKGLSTSDPLRAVNSPVAESTIMGVAVGLASYGKRPCFEIQFVDFIYPGWNQLVSNMATLRWRSFGNWKCPVVIYAPCGGYLPGGALWHSQSAEGSFARQPGIRVAVPSTPEDAAGLFWTAINGEDPTVILLPKHLMWAEQQVPAELPPVPLGKARLVAGGAMLTLVTWGNCIELVAETLAGMDEKPDVEIIDLRSISPWDRESVAASVRKTGRLLVVQEDNVSCSVGQMILAEMCADASVLGALKSPPALVSKADVHIGFNPIYEYAALPDKERVRAAIDRVLSSALEISLASGSQADTVSKAAGGSITMSSSQTKTSEGDVKHITVPILGEGIRTARIVGIHKAAGELVKADDPLCEVETDKAVFPIECDEDGWLVEWKVAIDDEVSVGQEIAVLDRSGNMQVASLPKPAPDAQAQDYDTIKLSAGLSQEVIRALEGIVPATIEVTCRWEAVRDARLRSKKLPGPTISTTVMTSWCVAQAMAKHERFSSILRGNELIHDPERFDMGVAVAREGDSLETAVIANAGNLPWEEFLEDFNETVRRVRHGAVDSKNRVSLTISSMGPYQVRSAIPIVVPPSIATLFVGAPYSMPDPKSKSGELIEVCSLVLTFDHRWINGVGAASFLADVRKGIERFDRL